MRLTLRTLLSWKDGMLDGATATDLAARVEASDTARTIVQRINEVVTRPTLSAPAVDATGFAADPNTAAGYLDNVLTADELAEFERVCFASEAQLAETAGVHELLAAWSRDPRGPLDATARRRLLAAVRARTAADPRAGSTHSAEATSPRRDDDPRVAAAETRSASRRAVVPPSRPASTPVAAWLLAVTALVLLAALVGMLSWSLTKGGPRRRPVADEVAVRADAPVRKAAARPDAAAGDAAGAVAVTTRDANPVTKVTAAEPATPSSPPAAAKPQAGPPVAPTTPSGPHEPVASPPPADPDPATHPPADTALAEPREPVPPSAPPPVTNAPMPPGAVERRVPQGDALAIAAPAVAAPAAVHSAGPPTPAAPADRGDPVVEGRPIVLERPVDADLNAWSAGADGSPLELPVDLIAPPFCRPTLLVDGMRIRLEPGTRATLGRDSDGTPRLEVVFGGAALAGAGRLGITAGGLAGVVTVALAAPVGVEVRLERGPGEPAEATRRAARLVSAAGPLAWQPTADADGGPDAGARVIPPAHGQTLEWRSGPPPTLTAEAVSQSPSWLIGRDAGDPVERLAAEALSKRLAAGTAAVPALRELAGDRRPENRLAAAATLALVGDFEALARLLAADGPGGLRDGEWTRLEAIAVQQALARGPRAADAFARAIAAHVPPGVADTVVRLAGGFSPADLEAGAADELVAAIGSPHLVVRRYAVRNLVALTGDETARSRYRPDGTDEADRAKAAAWWRARLAQGLVPDGAAAAVGNR